MIYCSITYKTSYFNPEFKEENINNFIYSSRVKREDTYNCQYTVKKEEPRGWGEDQGGYDDEYYGEDRDYGYGVYESMLQGRYLV